MEYSIRLGLLADAYTCMLRVSVNDPARANQSYQMTLAALRDEIAKHTGRDAESVQREYEGFVAWSKPRAS